MDAAAGRQFMRAVSNLAIIPFYRIRLSVVVHEKGQEMTSVQGKCSACGAPLTVKVAQPFAIAGIAAPLCSECSDQLFLDQGGALLTLRRPLEGARFRLGNKVTITAGAVAALGETAQHAVEFLLRHVRGDWGAFGQCDQIDLTADEEERGWEATDDSARINKSNLLNLREQIMSEYQTSSGRRLWVVTRLDGTGGTTVLLPEEY
jgi:hypothetical protein